MFIPNYKIYFIINTTKSKQKIYYSMHVGFYGKIVWVFRPFWHVFDEVCNVSHVHAYETSFNPVSEPLL